MNSVQRAKWFRILKSFVLGGPSVFEENNTCCVAPDISGLEADLAEVEQHLRRVEVDDLFSPAERELDKLYYIHWRKRLERVLASQSAHSNQPSQQAKDAQPAPLNQVKPSDESWKVITPPALLRAVTKIRDDCEQLCDIQRDHLNDKCFKELHPVAPGMTEPAIFKNYFYDCSGKIREIVKYTFGRFWGISLNQDGLIGAASVQWASLQVIDLIEREDKLVESWIKSVCDKRNDIRPASNEEFMQKVVYRTDWRAPKWLSMQPNGNVAYDTSTAWERMNEDDTRRTLRYLRESRWIIILKSSLKELVGASHEVLAKRKPSSEKTPQGGEQVPMPEAPEGTRQSRSTKRWMKSSGSSLRPVGH